MNKAPPLIVGGGRVGLGAAVYLAQAGIPTRIIDATEEPSSESRALAVNPRTLETIGFLEGLSADVGRSIAVGPFSDAQERRADRGAA